MTLSALGILVAIQTSGEPSAGPARHLGDISDDLNTLYRHMLNLPEQASTFARHFDYLHYVEITIMFAVAAAIAVIGVVFTARYHRRGTEWVPTPRVVASTLFEIGVYGGLFVLFLAFWIVGFRRYVNMLDAPQGALRVYVTGKQWVWKFSYPEGPSSAGVLYVPAGRPVQLSLTSRDVIHSFYVPEFRIKRDAVPGMYTTIWFEAIEPGRYEVLCAELCGVGHSRMRAEVVALAPRDFEAWLSGRAPSVETRSERAGPQLQPTTDLTRPTNMADLGRAVAARRGCLRCHTVDGMPHIGPTWFGMYGARERLASGDTVLVDDAYITDSMMHPQEQIVAGFPPIMPSFLGQITPAETSAIIEYMRSLSDAAGEVRPLERSVVESVSTDTASAVPPGAVRPPPADTGSTRREATT